MWRGEMSGRTSCLRGWQSLQWCQGMDKDVSSSGFIQEIEHALGLGPAKQCPLRDFLTVYIKNIFLNQVLAEINKEIEGVTKTSDPLKILANADTMKVMGVQRPLLQSTIIVEKTVQDLMNLMHDLSAYSDQFLNMVCVKLQEYKDTCAAACR